MDKFNVKKVKEDCVNWIRDWFEKNGKGCNAIIGISGGLDSSVVAGLCVAALGKEKVIGVLMPRGHQRDICFADMLCDFLDIKRYEIDIKETLSCLELQLALNHIRPSDQTLINLPARIRMATLYAVSQSWNGRVANTCNLSEDWVGYSTRWGDSVGDFSPLANLTKTEVKELAKELGLPQALVEKVPSDGLCGKTDEDNLGFTYAELDKYIRTGYIEDEKHKEKIDTLHSKNLFKLRPMPSFEY